MIEVLLDTGEVAGRTPPAAGERPGIYLIEDRPLPPGCVHGDDGKERATSRFCPDVVGKGSGHPEQQRAGRVSRCRRRYTLGPYE
jgi:hypothetical protein